MRASVVAMLRGNRHPARPTPDPATVVGRTALAGMAVSIGLVAATGVLGPSVAEPPLGPRGVLPPYSLALQPDPWLVTWLLGAALLLGGAAIGLALIACRIGWTPPARRLLLAGAIVAAGFVLIPPMGSGDHLSYAAYGRIAAIGHDPYQFSPRDLANMGDPIGRAVERPWTWTPSVYGPIATVEQLVASYLGGDSVRHTVFVLALVNAAAFVVAGWLLVHVMREDPAARARAALLWAVNPLLLYECVLGMHVDTIAVAVLVAAVLVLRRSAVGTGVLLGVASAVKISATLGAAGIAWAARPWPAALRRRGLTTLLVSGGCALVVFVGLYAVAGPHAFDQMHRASEYVSLATPGHLFAEWAEPLFGHDLTRFTLRFIGAVALAAVAALLLAFMRRRFAGAGPGRLGGPVGHRAYDAVWVTAAFVLAWLFTAPYALPWYDAFGWAFLAMLPASRLDVVFLLRAVVLCLAYVPGRIAIPHDLAHVTLGYRSSIAPWLTLTLLCAVVVAACVRRRRYGDAS